MKNFFKIFLENIYININMQTKINVELHRSFSLISRYIIKNLDQSRLYNFFKFKKKKKIIN